MKLQGTVINKKDITRFEVTAVYTHPQATVDIVLVHGLNGQPQKTWTAKNGVYWPTELLPYTLEKAGARANIIVYGYNADVTGENPSTEFVHDKAQTLVTFLTAFRKTSGTLMNPILWVVHSLGGIVTKQALIYSDGLHDANKEDERSVYISTFGIIFLGTPHSGSELAAWGEMLQRMVGFVPRRIFDSEPVLIKTLRSNSETLRAINLAFTNMVGRFKIHLVHEAHKTDLKGTKAFVVDSQSAAPEWATAKSYGIEADHSGMCKFESNTAPGYRPVSSALVEWALIANRPDHIPSRWIVEKQSRTFRSNIEKHVQDGSLTEVIDASSGATQIADLTKTVCIVPRFGNSTSAENIYELPPSPMLPLLQTSETSLAQGREPPTTQGSGSLQQPLFIRPEAFRPNSYSVGREEELEDLHTILQDPKRRFGGTSAVLIHGATGVGKSHLAREYVYTHQKQYPGGIFWFRAFSEQELEDEFWRFSTTTALAERNGQDNVPEFQDHAKMVEHVRNWFSRRQDWLFVLDGIMFNPVLKRFVPDTANTAMILTSTSRAFTGNFHFNNPKPLELKALPALEGCELLRQELEKKVFTAEEDASALDLVRLLDNLPLHIHIISQNLKMTQEPLPTFVKRFRARPRLSQQIPAYDFVLDQLADMGAFAAVNVLSVLAFFERNIPVEMLALGLPALPRNLPYKTRDAGLHDRASFNQTIKVLIAFALVERISSYELSPSSSRTSKKSLDFSNETMDTLRTHTMLQRYMIDYKMEREKTHIDWLEHAVGVFFLAFEGADKRIKETPRIGLPDDYRRFALHGKKLLEHLTQYEKKYGQLSLIRQQLEHNLEYIKAATAYLSDAIHAKTVNQSGDIQQTSVFDRANSLSESDSGTASDHSQESWISAGEYPDQLVMSPVAVADYGERLYDQDEDGSLSMPSPYGNDELTPTLHGTPKPPQYQQSGFPLPFPSDSGPALVTRKYRTYSHDYLLGRKNDNRKSQPDIGVSRETVEAPRYPFNTTHRRVSGASVQGHASAQSDAELALTQIRQASPTPPRGGGRIQGKGRTYSGASQTRPLDMMKTTGYTKGYATSGLTPTEEPTLAELSKDFNIPPPPGASYSSTFQRFKENMNYFKRRRSSASSNSKQALEVPSSAHTSPGVEQMARMPPFPVLPTRSARSSPGQGVAPFYPPDTSDGRAISSSLRRPGNLPPKFQQWSTAEVPYHPPLDRIDSSNLGQNPMAMSFPSPERPTHRQGSGGFFTPAAWLQGQEDAVAAPMSRGSSYPSSNSNPSHNSRKRSSDSGRLGIPGTAERSRRGSSPHASPSSPAVAAHFRPPMVPPRASSNSSRPASIMTEPSPRISPRYDTIDPPYQTPLNASRHTARPRAGSQSSGYSLGSYVPSGASGASTSGPVTMPETAIPPTPSRRDGRHKRSWGWGNKMRGNTRRRGRAHSASPSAGLRGGSSSPRYQQERCGEDMSRSGSGGSGGLLVRDASGTPQMIGFGDVPPAGSLISADERTRSGNRGPRQRQQQSMQSPPMSRSSSGGVGLGITPEGEVTD